MSRKTELITDPNRMGRSLSGAHLTREARTVTLPSLPTRCVNSGLLLKDTSRLARRRVILVLFKEQECLRHGMEVIYANIPDGDAITTMLLKSLLQTMDEWHSLTSRQKGLTRMAENVRQGYRGSGRIQAEANRY
jgi:hypothetical protein